jgi:hypothetical protein
VDLSIIWQELYFGDKEHRCTDKKDITDVYIRTYAFSFLPLVGSVREGER